jgi:hypothetical protein
MKKKREEERNKKGLPTSAKPKSGTKVGSPSALLVSEYKFVKFKRKSVFLRHPQRRNLMRNRMVMALFESNSKKTTLKPL